MKTPYSKNPTYYGMLHGVIDLERIFGRPTQWKLDISFGTWGVRNLMGQAIENIC
jgi:hypothetical protein